MAELIFAVSLVALVYVYFGYPLLLLLRARLVPRPVRRAPIRPRLTVVVPAYNEAAVIARKLEDTLANGYPLDRLEVLVASDGSTDATDAIVRGHPAPQVRLLALPHRGKLAALNDAAAAATGEILAFTDADVFLDPGSLGALVSNFADPEVGGVTGRKAPARSEARGDSSSPDGAVGRERRGAEAPGARGSVVRGEGLYARYDEWQKRLEGEAGSTVASHGALHALRRELYVPVEDATVADDQALSARVVLRGHRLAYEPAAVARVEPSPSDGQEFRRKVRIANQVLRALFGLGAGLWSSGFYSVQLVSHKLLRYLAPLFMILLLMANLALAIPAAPLWRAALIAQLTFYALAGAGWLLRDTGLRRSRLFGVPYYFCLANGALLLALVSFLRGERAADWTPRSGFHTRRT